MQNAYTALPQGEGSTEQSDYGIKASRGISDNMKSSPNHDNEAGEKNCADRLKRGGKVVLTKLWDTFRLLPSLLPPFLI